MITPLAYTDSLRIGSVAFVSPDKIEVQLDIEAPANVALNAGNPRPFPRINSYVLIPSEGGFLVSQVEWIGIERSPYPKRKGLKDFGIIDLPFPLRKMCLMPLGILREQRKPIVNSHTYFFSRGVEVFPTVGDSVLLPTQEQLLAVIESGDNRRIKIGISPLVGNADVLIDPDKLFGRHLAVLGNTGSGKSCSVAGLIRWSLEKAASEFSDKHPNARFVILDPNGEYANAFKDTKDSKIQAKIFCVGAEENSADNVYPLRVPLWFWNSAEWCSFAQASAKTQRPLLIQTLKYAREGITISSQPINDEIRRYLRTILVTLRLEKNSGTPWGIFPKPKSFCSKIDKYKKQLLIDCNKLIQNSNEYLSILEITKHIENLVNARSGNHPEWDFSKQEIDELIEKIANSFLIFGGLNCIDSESDFERPQPFTSDVFLHILESTAEMLNVETHAETLIMRVRGLLADSRMKSVIGDSEGLTLESWLNDYLGQGNSITIIDLSLVPTEIVHITVSVIARIIFEALQRYRRDSSGQTLPTVMVMEEAHTFIKRYKDDIENQDAATICCQVFEKIAREGRKFGLGLVLSSQRPSELSPTVLSQCNSFLLHRINNDKDQEQAQKFIPDNLRGLLRELPALPSRNAILLGWASEIPVLVHMNELPLSQRPQSEDPDFWNVWTEMERNVNWKEIAENWQNNYGQSNQSTTTK